MMALHRVQRACMQVAARGLARSISTRAAACSLPHSIGLTDPHTVSVVGVPLKYGQGLDGAETAPGAIRDSGLLREIADLGWRVTDRGDVDVAAPSHTDPTGPGRTPRHSYSVGVSSERTAKMTEEAARDGHFVLSLGGDHAIAIGSISGILKARPNVGVIWVDAHADINSPEHSASSNAHGMPVAFLVKHVKSGMVGYEWMDDVPALDPTKQLVYIGLRDLDGFEKGLIKELGIKTFTMQQVDKYGIGQVMEQAIDHLFKNGKVPIHLSFDIDGCDPDIAPSTGTTVPGGLNFRESSYICEAIAETGALCSMDMVEVNPKLGDSHDGDKTVTLAKSLIKDALGQTIL